MKDIYSKCLRKNISFMGASLSTGNMGVSALCASFVKIMMNVKPDAKIFLFIGNRTSETQHLRLKEKELELNVVNHRFSPKANPKEHLLWIFFLSVIQKLMPIKKITRRIIQSNTFLKEIDQCMFVGNINGGDSFSDIYGVTRFTISSIPSIITIFLGKKLVLLPQTFGPFKSKISKVLAKYILNRAYRIYTRDKNGLSYLKQYLTKNSVCKKPIFCADIAFMLDSIMPNKIDLDPGFSFNLSKPLIGININGLMYNGGYTKKNMFGLCIDYKSLIEMLIQILISKTDCCILLIPHTFGQTGNINSDLDASKSIMKKLTDISTNRVSMLSRIYDQSELKGIINLCDFFIGSRMHSCIAALSQGIPTIGIAYSKKFKGVFDSIGMEKNVLDARILDEQNIINKILEFYQKRNESKEEIKRQVDTAQKQILTIFKEFASELYA
jgi:polysaccharide pyruvyl transferase WcaK-like protein